MKQYRKPTAFLLVTSMVAPCIALAQGPPKPSSLENPLAQILVIIIIALALIIGLMANVVIGAAQLSIQKVRDERAQVGQAAKIIALIAAVLVSASAWAQDAPPAAQEAVVAVVNKFGGLSEVTFFTLISVIVLEIVVLIALIYNLQLLLRKELIAVAAPEAAVDTVSVWEKWWDKINNFKSAKEEEAIDMGHDYDGIRELDNALPPWWLYGFYVCVIFAGIYLWRYHVSHDAPLSGEEYAIAVAKGEADKEAYLKTAASKVDENSVIMLTEAADLEAGKKIFATVCAACHVADGGGAVGPNLTDAYWLHGGSIKDVFKSIKYGWPEKGMRSWKDDYNPVQLAQLASYVKSLKGTKPAKPKEPQGALFTEEAPGAKPATDSTKTVAVVPAK